jgi:hypothetical protein
MMMFLSPSAFAASCCTRPPLVCGRSKEALFYNFVVFSYASFFVCNGAYKFYSFRCMGWVSSFESVSNYNLISVVYFGWCKDSMYKETNES